jgi:hypothetical protein
LSEGLCNRRPAKDDHCSQKSLAFLVLCWTKHRQPRANNGTAVPSDSRKAKFELEWPSIRDSRSADQVQLSQNGRFAKIGDHFIRWSTRFGMARPDENAAGNPGRRASFDVAYFIPRIAQRAGSSPRSETACKSMPGLGLRHG